jgi:hypothetical protein
MPNTYDSAVLDGTAAGLRNRVRFELDDTDTTTFEFQDAEVDYLLSGNRDNVLLAACAGARRLAMTYTRKASSSTLGPLSVSNATKAADFARLAEILESRARSEGDGLAPIPWAGGIEREVETSGVQPRFYRDMFDNEGTQAEDVT